MPPWTCKSDLWEPSYKLFKRNQQKFNSGLYLDPAVEKCSQDPLKSIFRPLHLIKYFIPHILQAVYAKKSGEKKFSQKKWRGHCGLTHLAFLEAQLKEFSHCRQNQEEDNFLATQTIFMLQNNGFVLMTLSALLGKTK